MIEHRDELAALMRLGPGHEIETAHERFVDYIRRGRPAWFTQAACRGVGPEVFYVERGADVRPAKALCAACPVIDACRSYAAANHVDGGIWAGVTATKIRSSGHHAA